MTNASRAGGASAALELAGFRYIHRPGNGGPTLLLLHGTGGDEHDLLDLGAYLAPDAALVSPRGRAPETEASGRPVNRWFARLAPGVLDEADIRRRAAELAQFVPAAGRCTSPPAPQTP